jgi:hypothetical protein
VIFSAKADALFRDERKEHGFTFESDQKEVGAGYCGASLPFCSGRKPRS